MQLVYEKFNLTKMLHQLKLLVESKINEKNIHYIEDNTYVTAHQTTNVYSDPLAKYEVRVDDQALDIQINR